MKEEFNFRREVIKEFEKKTTFTKEELSTIYAILGIKFDKFIELLKDIEIWNCSPDEYLDKLNQLAGSELVK